MMYFLDIKIIYRINWHKKPSLDTLGSFAAFAFVVTIFIVLQTQYDGFSYDLQA